MSADPHRAAVNNDDTAGNIAGAIRSQEKGNLAFALQHGIALPITNYRKLPRIVDRLMNDSAEYAAMRDNMRRMKNEEAIFEVAETVLSLLPKPSVSD